MKKYRENYRHPVDIFTGLPIITSLAHQPGAVMTTKPKLTTAQKQERNDAALKFAAAIAGSTIIFEVLDKTDGKFTSQVNRVAFEMADDFVRRAAS